MLQNKYLKTLAKSAIWFISIGVFVLIIRSILTPLVIRQAEVSEVDTRIITGLLTATSIVFGFSINYLMKKKTLRVFSHSVLIIQLLFIITAGSNLYRLGLGLSTSVETLQQVAITFYAVFILNAISIGFYVIDEFEDWWE